MVIKFVSTLGVLLQNSPLLTHVLIGKRLAAFLEGYRITSLAM